MTTKRFRINPSAIVDDVTVIMDDEKQYSFPILDSTLNYMFCKVLNELANENKQLKKENNEYQRIFNEKCICKELDDVYKENGQFKKQNKRLHDDLHKINQIARGY